MTGIDDQVRRIVDGAEAATGHTLGRTSRPIATAVGVLAFTLVVLVVVAPIVLAYAALVKFLWRSVVN